MDKKAKIVKEDGMYVLYTSDKSRVLGRHKTKEKALRQERAIWASKKAEVVFKKLAEAVDADDLNLGLGIGGGLAGGDALRQAKNLYRKVPENDQKALLDIMEPSKRMKPWGKINKEYRNLIPTKMDWRVITGLGLGGLVAGSFLSPFLASNSKTASLSSRARVSVKAQKVFEKIAISLGPAKSLIKTIKKDEGLRLSRKYKSNSYQTIEDKSYNRININKGTDSPIKTLFHEAGHAYGKTPKIMKGGKDMVVVSKNQYDPGLTGIIKKLKDKFLGIDRISSTTRHYARSPKKRITNTIAMEIDADRTALKLLRNRGGSKQEAIEYLKHSKPHFNNYLSHYAQSIYPDKKGPINELGKIRKGYNKVIQKELNKWNS